MRGMVSEATRQKITRDLISLYGENLSISLAVQIEHLIDKYRQLLPEKNTQFRFSERDAVLITYGDMVKEAGSPPLDSLAKFLFEFSQLV